ncbi:MAG: DUF4869 domain-containing protein [Clostridiales bacterium]|nr:DUF4869 domain-containing protein [Clostridiales bacterium]
MLNIYFGHRDDEIRFPQVYFKNAFEPEWMNDPLVKEMVFDIDKSKVIAPYVIESPIFGQIPPQMLSGGVKTLILAHKIPDKIFYISGCGDNCAKWFLKIAENKDVTVTLGYPMDFGEGPFHIKLLNTGEVVHSRKEMTLSDAIDNI